jgi:hypothetical protein
MIIPSAARETKTIKQEVVAEFRVWAGVVFFAVLALTLRALRSKSLTAKAAKGLRKDREEGRKRHS